MTDQATPAALPDTLAARRPAGAHCRSCGGPWFGEVDYCPYCGRSASAPAPAALEATPSVDALPTVDASPEPATNDWSTTAPAALDGDARSWKSWATPLAAGAVFGVVLVLLVALFAGDWPAFRGALRAPGRDAEPAVQQQAPPTRGQDAQRP